MSRLCQHFTSSVTTSACTAYAALVSCTVRACVCARAALELCGAACDEVCHASHLCALACLQTLAGGLSSLSLRSPLSPLYTHSSFTPTPSHLLHGVRARAGAHVGGGVPLLQPVGALAQVDLLERVHGGIPLGVLLRTTEAWRVVLVGRSSKNHSITGKRRSSRCQGGGEFPASVWAQSVGLYLYLPLG